MGISERLREGTRWGWCLPAFPVKEEERDGCVKLLEGMGYRVKLGTCLENMYNFHNYLAGMPVPGRGHKTVCLRIRRLRQFSVCGEDMAVPKS